MNEEHFLKLTDSTFSKNTYQCLLPVPGCQRFLSEKYRNSFYCQMASKMSNFLQNHKIDDQSTSKIVVIMVHGDSNVAVTERKYH